VPIAGLLLAGLALLAAWLARPAVERYLTERLLREGLRRGLIIRVDEVRVGLFPPVTLSNLTITRPGSFRLVTRKLGVGLAPWGHGHSGLAWRAHLDEVAVSLPAGVELAIGPSVWDLRPTRRGRRLTRRLADEQLDVEWTRGDGQEEIKIAAENLQLSGFLEIRRGGTTLGDLGVVGGEARIVRSEGDRLRLVARGHGRQMRFATIARVTEAAGPASPSAATAGDSPVTDAELQIVAVLAPQSGDIEIEECRLAGGGVALSVKGAVRHMLDDPGVDLHLSVERVDFARLLATAGLDLPSGVSHFGSAALDLDVRGHARDPGSFVVRQSVNFTPPDAPIPAIERLRGAFVAEVHARGGQTRQLLIGPESPDFIALGDVPPLFVRALLLSEDAGFYGHHGLDFAEMPVAMATNWLRGTPSRGASTITQQLAKNLFLTREKSVSRKLSEAALALLLDSTLGKQRVLEIYLNVIEWGPDLYGLRPAARHYFGKEPQELTPKEAAFLVALIPGPVKYQRSFADGAPTAAFENLIVGVLAKLRSVDAIDEEQYQAALGETLLIRASRSVPSSSSEEQTDGGGVDDSQR
jgi:hypothetical protein